MRNTDKFTSIVVLGSLSAWVAAGIAVFFLVGDSDIDSVRTATEQICASAALPAFFFLALGGTLFSIWIAVRASGTGPKADPITCIGFALVSTTVGVFTVFPVASDASFQLVTGAGFICITIGFICIAIGSISDFRNRKTR